MKRKMILALILLIGFLFVRSQHDAWVAHPSLTRPFFILLIPFLMVMCFISIRAIGAWNLSQLRRIWRLSLKQVGWGIPLIHFILLLVGLALISTHENIHPQGVITLITPAVMGFHAALLFSPSDERVLELLLTYPQALLHLVIGRITLCLGLHLSIAVGVQALVSVTQPEIDFMGGLVAWVPATLLLFAFGFSITLRSRELVFGILIVLIVLITTGFAVDSIYAGMPDLWGIFPYIPQQRPFFMAEIDFLINRVVVILLACYLLFSALRQLQNTEWILTGKDG